MASSLGAFSLTGLPVSSKGWKVYEKNPSVFDKWADEFDTGSRLLGTTLKLSGERPQTPSVSTYEIMHGRSSAVSVGPGGRKRIAVSVLLSALLPGLGELYLYRESREISVLARVPVFFALEGYLWYGYDHNHSKGRDFERQYKEFADAHWDLGRFLLQQPCCNALGGCTDCDQYDECCKGDYWYFPFIPKEIDEEEYYENIGKYDAFVFGWDDWNSQPDMWTPNRNYYWSLRGESDKYLLRGDHCIMFLIVSRVVSMLDSGWLAYRMGRGEEQKEGWSLELEGGHAAPALILSYSF